MASRQAAPRIGITELRSATQEQSRLAVGNEQSELGLDGDEACGIRQNALPINVRLLFTYSCFRRTRKQSHKLPANSPMHSSGEIGHIHMNSLLSPPGDNCFRGGRGGVVCLGDGGSCEMPSCLAGNQVG